MRTVIQRKLCSKCGQRKRLSEFYVNTASKDGLSSWCKLCKREQVDVNHDRCRAQVFEHYGSACRCCGATESLTLDHVHGNGEEHRKVTGSGTALYSYLVSRDFPAECEPGGEFELRVLCNPCNCSAGQYEDNTCKIDHTGRQAAVKARTLAEMAARKAVRDARIIELRALGWTQAKIAAEVGCTQPTIGRVLRVAAAA